MLHVHGQRHQQAADEQSSHLCTHSCWLVCPAVAPLQPCPAHMITPDMIPNSSSSSSLSGQASVDAAAATAVTSVEQCITLPGYGFDGTKAAR